MKEDMIRAMAEQAYSMHLLVKTLRERGVLKEGEPIQSWKDAEFQEFLRDYAGNYFPGVAL